MQLHCRTLSLNCDIFGFFALQLALRPADERVLIASPVCSDLPKVSNVVSPARRALPRQLRVRIPGDCLYFAGGRSLGVTKLVTNLADGIRLRGQFRLRGTLLTYLNRLN